MRNPIVPWLTRRPTLIDSGGAPVPTTPPPVLLVDPDAARANQLILLLDRPTQHITEDLVAVLVALAVEKPQLVVLVHDPPALDAVAFCESLRAASDVPIIVLMTVPGGSDRARALWAGADDALALPVALAELHARIAALLRRCRTGAMDRHHKAPASEQGRECS